MQHDNCRAMEIIDMLRPSRRPIVQMYLQLSEVDHRSTFYIIQAISRRLGYKLDVNGSNSHVMKVLREFRQLEARRGLTHSS